VTLICSNLTPPAAVPASTPRAPNMGSLVCGCVRKVKGVGQECPTYTGKVKGSGQECPLHTGGVKIPALSSAKERRGKDGAPGGFHLCAEGAQSMGRPCLWLRLGKVKGVGQECPLHTGKVKIPTLRLRSGQAFAKDARNGAPGAYGMASGRLHGSFASLDCITTLARRSE
jgi:hypothetical protein